ncbi:choice-of-anchor P family protein [Streptomyces cavernicola]|uniref:Choice-of-anchor P family protein n=1 Tax=Streptomyces cavernicola TaxID=3043613 RepID=A0ABT6S9Z3_9ACTN|nr:choice-of-anchor P family protein [Streptomyces sp. B-S-A6]MDI3404997.1 choice-of-anchor P family protein [Streptomyces sp. B-S-A6]
MASVKMGVGRAALGVAFAASLVATTAGTAHAAAGESSAYGAAATLGTVVDIPETAKSAYPGGPPSADLATLALGGMGSVNALSTTATGDSTTGVTQSTARTAQASLNLDAATVGADAVTATCDAKPGSDPTGSATVTNGAATTPLSIGDVTFPANPAPNTDVTLPGGLGSVVLNEQITNPDGSLTVNAMHIKVASPTHLAGDVVIASATCKAGTADEGAITNVAVDENGDRLGGVAFELREDGARVAAPSCTGGENGSCTFPNLANGQYEVCVTDVPDGYKMPKPRCKDNIDVNDNHRWVRFVIPEENGKKKG